MQILTFLRGDLNCTFEQGCGPKPAFAVYLKGLESVVALPKDMSTRIAHEKGVLPCGPPRTFLKAGENKTSIPSKKADRLKDAPHTVFARCLYQRTVGKVMQADRYNIYSVLSIQYIHNDV